MSSTPAVVVAAGATPEGGDVDYKWNYGHIAAVVKCTCEGDRNYRHLGSFGRLAEFEAVAVRWGLISEIGPNRFRPTALGQDLYERVLRHLPEGRANAWVSGAVAEQMKAELAALEKADQEAER